MEKDPGHAGQASVEKDMEKAQNDIEKLKDQSREMKFTNGNHK